MTFLISSITPVIIFLYLVYNKDTIKEPPGILLKCFFGGFLSIVLALLIDYMLEPLGKGFTSPLFRSFFDAFFQAGFPEELSKFLILYWVAAKHKNFDQHYDGIIYAVFVSMGFALIENLMYVYKGGMSVAVIRAVLAVPGHGFDGVIMGYYFSLAKFHKGEERNEYFVKALFVPVFLHGMYDFALMYMSKSGDNVFLILGLIILFSYIVIKTWQIGLKKIELHYEKDKNAMVQEVEREG